ncbi:hypothetical protein [Sphingomonas solaris]|nr:hypothetical protein [Sphingomonas solaris]
MAKTLSDMAAPDDGPDGGGSPWIALCLSRAGVDRQALRRVD